MKRFSIDKNYGDYLSKMGFSLEAVLKKAMLPKICSHGERRA